MLSCHRGMRLLQVYAVTYLHLCLQNIVEGAQHIPHKSFKISI